MTEPPGPDARWPDDTHLCWADQHRGRWVPNPWIVSGAYLLGRWASGSGGGRWWHWL